MLDLAWGLRFLSPGQDKTRALQVSLILKSSASHQLQGGMGEQAGHWSGCTTESKGYKGILTAPHAQPKPCLFSQT